MEDTESRVFSFSRSQLIYLKIKRVLDIVFSVSMLIPLFFLAIMIRFVFFCMKENGPLFYKQLRRGKDGKEFEIIKFRSMSRDAEELLKELLKDDDNKNEWEEYHKLKNDPRIIPFGLFLRKSSLDEFPQFINVLKGDMSIIGPRPLVPGELKMHNGLPLYETIKPGITGWWACNGRSVLTYKERLEYEYEYIRNVSLRMDIKVFFKTILCVINKVGAH
ncbi:MAG: sugar transferase [Erysipelotrichaceae bacterium]|nr:sugar transferase [Erysipelotrichaceae bacterium]